MAIRVNNMVMKLALCLYFDGFEPLLVAHSCSSSGALKEIRQMILEVLCLDHPTGKKSVLRLTQLAAALGIYIYNVWNSLV